MVLIVSSASTARASTEKVLYAFTGGNDGSQAEFGVIRDGAGNLYGNAGAGGAYGFGVVFELSPDSGGAWNFNVLYTFTGTGDGGFPSGGLTMEGAGNLYGTAAEGGNPNCTGGCGVVFELSPVSNGWKETVLYSFQGGARGWSPGGGVIFDTKGDLYGMTGGGGDLSCPDNPPGIGCGTVYELTPQHGGTWTGSLLHVFHGHDGASPVSNLTFDRAGNLYGATEVGGRGAGTVFELSPQPGGNWAYGVLALNGLDGSQPQAGIAFDSQGNGYGTTRYGGKYGDGAIFKGSFVAGSGWNVSPLHSFTGQADGEFPQSGLTFDSSGNFYGTTSSNSTGGGVVFKGTPSPNGWTGKALWYFQTQSGNGYYPIGSLTLDPAGNIYGTTFLGGNTNDCVFFENVGCGVVYEIIQ